MAPISFPFKLWDAVNDENDKLIRWSDDGTAVIINEPLFDIIGVKCYPTLLRLPTLTNLRRMFHWYEFQRSVPVDDRGMEITTRVEYRHACFVRNRHDLVFRVASRYPTKRSHNANEINDYRHPASPVMKTEKRVLSPPIGASFLSSFRLPNFLNLDSYLDDRSSETTPCSPSWPVSTIFAGHAKDVRFRNSFPTTTTANSSILRPVVGCRNFTVRLRNCSTTTVTPTVVVGENCDDEETVCVGNDSVESGSGSSLKRSATHLQFGDEESTWFGLANEPVVRRVELGEFSCMQDMTGDENGELRSYTCLT